MIADNAGTVDRQAVCAEVVAPDRAALLVIDVQNDFVQPHQKDVLDRLAELIRSARNAGVRVIYIQNGVLPDGSSDSPADTLRRRTLGLPLDATIVGTEGHRFAPEVAPEDADVVIPKHRMDSFTGTSLELVLRAGGIDTIVCTGVATHGCLVGTSYGAQARDFNVVVVRDCVASWDPDLHDAALRVLASTMVAVADADDVEAVWTAAGARAGGGAPGRSNEG